MNEAERIIEALCQRLEMHNENRKGIQDEVSAVCSRLRKQINDLEVRINAELEGNFSEEDNRLQQVLNDLRTALYSNRSSNADTDGNSSTNKEEKAKTSEKIRNALRKAKAALLVKQLYVLRKQGMPSDLSELCFLTTSREAVPEFLEHNKPVDVDLSSFKTGRVKVGFRPFSPCEEKALRTATAKDTFLWKAFLHKKGEESEKEYAFKEECGGKASTFTFLTSPLDAETNYVLRVSAITTTRSKEATNGESEWCEEIEFRTPVFSEYAGWKACPEGVEEINRYEVNESDLTAATKTGNDYHWSTIIGNTPLPQNKVTSWSVKALKSRSDDGWGIYVGVAQSDVDQNEGKTQGGQGHESKWCLECYHSTVFSGPPHNCWIKYGPRRGDGVYVCTMGSVGVVMDTAKGELSFVVDGVNLGIAYDGIPLDKPLVPCVLLGLQGDSVKLIV